MMTLGLTHRARHKTALPLHICLLACASQMFCAAGTSISGAEEQSELTPTTGGERGGPGETQVTPPATTVESVNARSLCKRGMASGRQAPLVLSAADLAAMQNQVVWWYNWSDSPDSTAAGAAAERLDIDFVPMVFTAPFDANHVRAQITPRTRFLLGYNEPNFTNEGNLTPSQAAKYWPQVQAIADAYHLKLVGPAVNYCGGGCNETDPIKWYQDFFAACPNCRVDYIAIHAYVCYGGALSGAYLDPFKKAFTQPLWLTEFACLDGSADGSKLASQKTLMQQAVALLEADPRVFRYAWFLARSSDAADPISLLTQKSGVLSELGSYYLTLPQACGI